MTPKGRKRLILIALIVVVYSLFCCKKTNVSNTIKTTTTDSQNANTDGGGSTGGGTGFVEIFEYYGDNTGMMIDFPSHSIVSKPVSNIGVDLGVANSFCEYWIYDSNNNLKVYCKNTRSGLHPNYANAFNSNNHLSNYSKRLAPGTYRLVYKNISTDTGVNQTLLFGLIANNANEQLNEVVTSGNTVERTLNIYNSETSNFKMNNNVYN